jgi:catechol 2,3-dioxygenase-like lactoylglutathione lyase family enzyme
MCCDFKSKGVGMKAISDQEESERFERQRQRISEQYLHTSGPHAASSAQGLHHVAFLSSDVERTVQFYQELLEFPLTAIAENRDYRGSSHFFFDIGNNNLLAFFDFPGLDLGPYQEVLGGLHHVAISVEPMRWERLRDRLIAANVELREHGDVSIYFQDPDGTRLELITYPLGKM